MAKDPAFLFYSKDFYEGTRTMLPEERACFVDLLIYQHQNGGVVPNDLRRLQLYCSGVSEACLIATLEAKFKLGQKGWSNSRLAEAMSLRKEFSKKQSVNGSVGQFWKRARQLLSPKNFKKLRETVAVLQVSNLIFYEKWILAYREPLAMLEAMLKHLGIVNANAIAIENSNETKNEIVTKKTKTKNPKTKKAQTKISKNNISKAKNAQTGVLVLPFASAFFEEQWGLWKEFKWKEFGFRYQSLVSEQAALRKLSALSSGCEEVAIAILHQSMAHGWKGLFGLKTDTHGNRGKQQGGATAAQQGLYSADFKRGVYEKLQSDSLSEGL